MPMAGATDSSVLCIGTSVHGIFVLSFFGGCWDVTKGLVHTKQALYL
jgi:hypothetical protein